MRVDLNNGYHVAAMICFILGLFYLGFDSLTVRDDQEWKKKYLGFILRDEETKQRTLIPSIDVFLLWVLFGVGIFSFFEGCNLVRVESGPVLRRLRKSRRGLFTIVYGILGHAKENAYNNMFFVFFNLSINCYIQAIKPLSIEWYSGLCPCIFGEIC